MLEQAMRQLPDRFREVLLLREQEGLSYTRDLGRGGHSDGTVMSTLSRARERFRHALSDLMRRQALPNGCPAVSDAKLQEPRADVVLA